jgi:hypothetical protein
MRWVKRGRIFAPCGDGLWPATHAQLPVADNDQDGSIRIYFAGRDKENRSSIGVMDVDACDPLRIVRIGSEPVLRPGKLGCFDDCGVLPSWVVGQGRDKYLFYIGINTSETVPGRSGIGIAVSSDGGLSFDRLFDGPVVDRCAEEPYLCTAACVVPGAPWRMWYVSGVGWEVVDGRPEPRYNIWHTTSRDGIHWTRPGEMVLDFLDEWEAGLARPSVMASAEGYRMWFCTRGSKDFRRAPETTYRLAYAESTDGVDWTRQPIQPGLDRSSVGWDSAMIAYPYVFDLGGRLHMLYNGNGFGKDGFGLAILEEES